MKLFTALLAGALLTLPTLANQLTTRQKELKAQIIKLAKQNTSNTQNRAAIRQDVELLLNEITRGLPAIDEQTWLNYATGSWKQIWADEENNDTPEIGRNFDRIFQYINSKGLAVNLGERIFPNGQRVTFALSVKGSVSGNVQETIITEGFFRSSPLLSGMSVEFLAKDILTKNYQVFTPTKLGNFPMGPINAKSDLTFLYLDNDLKIGTAPNVFTGISEMFILIKEDIIK